MQGMHRQRLCLPVEQASIDEIEELAVSRQKFDEDSAVEMMEDVQSKRVRTIDMIDFIAY